MHFVTGHGTGNDFVLIPDLDGVIDLAADDVRALCDRASGIGADGVVRITRGQRHDFFMDYRNADGSLAQMCGNGIRVMARYLETEGLVHGTTVIETRGGDRRVSLEPDGQIRVEMGRAEPPLLRAAPQVSVSGRTFPAVAVSLPNPHAVVFVDDLDEAGDLVEPPGLAPDAMFPEGANVEFCVVRAPGHVAMRVFERGVGETLSCGTGACAVAWAARRATDPPGPAEWIVDVPGGRLRVVEHDSGEIDLIGPAVLTASGDVPAGLVSSAGS